MNWEELMKKLEEVKASLKEKEEELTDLRIEVNTLEDMIDHLI